MKELAGRSELSVAQISKLESAKTDPSVSSLIRLASALGVQVNSLLADEAPRVNPLRKGEGYPYRRYTNSHEPVLETFLNVNKDARMRAEIIQLPNGADSGPELAHNGEEFFFVLEGRVAFYYGAEMFEMNEGDFLYFDNTVRHKWANLSETAEAKLLVCCSPPVF
jgi:mannose-6-phosphate isomerase-like protein (cupin superfamily)